MPARQLTETSPSMKVAVIKETGTGERRVAASAATVRKMVDLGLTVAIQAGAGAGSYIADEAYASAGAQILPGAAEVLGTADIVLKVLAPSTEAPDELGMIKEGAILIGSLAPYDFPDLATGCQARNITAFAMEQLPRIARAQSMDVLSSQSNLSGYLAVVKASASFGQIFPMMMTAAGTLAPVKIFVIGAGVAGLQAVATARRLGGIASATDVRSAVAEQVESLGGKFIGVESEEDAETAGGYAKEMDADFQRRQAELIAETVKTQDIIITTALIPGQPAPTLLTDEMVANMKPGSVIVDLAAERGGNCTLTRPGETIEVHGVKILGDVSVARSLSVDASNLYANNLFNFLKLLVDEENGELNLDWSDEIIEKTAISGKPD